MTVVELLAVGNELLIGDVLDTNSHWLCRQLTHRGGAVRRIATVGDRPEDIARELRSSIERRADLVFVTGGLGPTEDDRTLGSVASAFGRALERNETALQAVRDRYEAFSRQGFVADAGLTKEREKMALLPEGAVPLNNPVGAAPGVLLEIGQTTIVCLPGVPGELRSIFETSLEPVLRNLLGSGGFVERVARVDCGDESRLAPLLAAAARSHPGTYIKSRPERFGKDLRILLTLSASGASKAEASERAANAWTDLADILRREGIGMESEALD